MDTGRLRKNIADTAKLFLGMPYLWGGRSASVPSRVQRAEQGAQREAIGSQVTSYKVQGTRTEREDRSGTLRHDTGGQAMEAEALALNLSPPTSNLQPIATGVDCSSLTNLAYRVNWLDIPRDAHDQWNTSTRITYETLEPACPRNSFKFLSHHLIIQDEHHAAHKIENTN